MLRKSSSVRALTLAFLLAAAIDAHPMGNFSVNHYARFDFGAQRTQLTYVLDLAEIPTLELLQQLRVPATNGAQLQPAIGAQAHEWLKQLHVSENGAPVAIHLQKVTAHLIEGAGGLQVLRVDIAAQIPSHPGTLEYQDSNYAERTGWKEIVIRAANGASISRSSQGSNDRSRALSTYPANEIAAPPQDVRSAVTWTAVELPKPAQHVEPPVAAPTPTPAPTAAPARPFSQQQRQPMGTLVQGDYLSRLLRHREIPFRLALIGVLFAFCLGAMHALSPGHGKTIVAAYLVGSRGTLQHALFLGGMVTFTHTISVFALGLGVLFFEQYIVPDRIIPVLGILSGLSIVAVGVLLMYQRAKALARTTNPRHDHDHHEHHHHPHSHAHQHVHSHGGGKPHSHVPEGNVSLGSLIALGVSGGLVPCPSALILLLSAIALGRTGLGLILLLGFSAGLALVLMAIGGLVIYAKRLLPEGRGLRAHPAFRYVPLFSAAVVIVLGLMMTGVSMGWITPSLSI